MDSASIARRDILLREMATIHLTNEKRVAQAQQVADVATKFDPEAVVAAAKDQLANQLAQAKGITDFAAADAATLTDTAGRYKDLFAEIDADAKANPNDLVCQYQKQLKDGFIAQAEAHKPEIATAAQAVTAQLGSLKINVAEVQATPVKLDGLKS